MLNGYITTYIQEEFEDTKGVIRICISTDNTMAKRKSINGETTVYRS